MTLQRFSQQGSSRSSKRQAGPVIQLHEHVAFGRQIELLYMVKIDDCIAMYPEKMTRIQQALEILHCLPNQMSRISHMQPNVVSERLQPQDVFNPDQNDLFTALCGHTLQESRPVRGLLMVAYSLRGG